MLGFGKKMSRKAALPPGTLVHIGEKRAEKVKITVVDYDKTEFRQTEVETVEECFPYKEKPTVTWINVDGLHDLAVIETIGEHFGLHPLVLEDVVNTEQRPKTEDFGDYVFMVLKMLYYDEEATEIRSEQVSLVLTSNCVISFQEREGDVFDPIRERIKKAKGRIRLMGSDYLAYALMDSIVDGYFGILERIGERVEDLEEGLLANPDPEILQAMHDLKLKMILLRKSVWPLREVVASLERAGSRLIHKSTMIYLRDVYDHSIQIMDTIETFRDMISGVRDTYLSSLSNRMNEVMKVLTIFASIFIPLTFLAGIYGMNFKYMPELDWRWSYPILLAVLIGVGLSLVGLFKRRKWL